MAGDGWHLLEVQHRTSAPWKISLVLPFLWGTPGCSSDDEPNEPGKSEGDGDETGGSSMSGDGDGDVGDGDEGQSGGASGDGDGDGSGGAKASGGTSPSLGCGKNVTASKGQWVEQTPLTVGGTARTWSAWFPEGYDDSEEYPVVFLFHGCGDGSDYIPLETEMGQSAILVRGLADGSDGCWLTADEGNGDFFEAMLEHIQETACTDSGRIFVAGYDSGAKLVSRLGCYQAYLIDAVATVAGDNALISDPTCNGPVAALMIHDDNDSEQDISGSEEVRDRLIDQNFCVSDGIPEPVEPEPCVQYSGCGDPVIWCETSGSGHDRQDEFAVPAIANFFSSL